ncbi:PTR2-domain-containing protein [Dacryopinax primogenitus]|uniref:PTR2-domain-containing protein n=1 Tax=Dacryopinax primogenitus (strain DJM 731) TaxID=1858805 RepID=M5FRY9_DACPD|nr:PTR2-domain-containing protein [Dacryopinax primogenitus]EJT97854.1 PTR2-domain-containing protein [Dacryopinax primogenitus]
MNVDYESAPVGPKGLPPMNSPTEEKSALATALSHGEGDTDEGEEPTAEELLTLRKVPAGMPWPALAMCLIEFAERASYYGCTGVFSNFIRGPLPKGGNGAGAVAPGPLGYNESAGALGMGVQAATALTTLFTFLAYTIPILGGIVADTKWGRFKTICVGTAVGAIAHVLLVIPALPVVIAGGKAIAAFIIAMLILAFAAGFIKPSLAPLLCDQSPAHHAVIKRLPSGERVILDPQTTVQRYLLFFYWAINIGAFFSVATSYAERDVGFWLAYLLPGIIYMLMPIVLVVVYKRLYRAPPQGSVVLECMRVFKRLLSHGGWKRMWKGGDDFWNHAKPSYIEHTEGSVDLKVVFWDDKFVDEVRQSISACKVFLLIPIFALADGGFGSTENAMSAAMRVNGVPNDVISNFNPLTIVVVAPILNFGFYPLLRKFNINLAPMTRMSIGFILASINMIIAAILQWKVYQGSPCGYYATSNCQIGDGVANISLWAQVPLYSLPAIGELFVNVTSYEIAYTRAPARMKGLVYAMVLFTSALSSALTEIVNPALVDPYLIWPYVALAVATALAAIAFPTLFKHLNDPVEFNDIDRMEGRQQPLAKAQAAAESGDAEKA